MLVQNAIKKILHQKDLSESEMTDIMHNLMGGHFTASQIAGFIVALEMKGVSFLELSCAVKVLKSFAPNIIINATPLIDIVGTGGDQSATFNISTTTAFVVAAAGGTVAKHGNRSVSSTSGSADVLELAGVNINLNHEQVKKCIEQIGVGFLFAPIFHPALKHAALPRKELGIRSFFNLLGPLINPTNPERLVVGVYDKKSLQLVAKTLLHLGCQRALIIHSEDGLDEISIAATTFATEIHHNEINHYKIDPKDFGFEYQSLDKIRVNSAAESYSIMHSVLNNEKSSARDIVALNAGAAIYIAGLASDIKSGIFLADQVITQRKALQKLNELIEFSNKFTSPGIL